MRKRKLIFFGLMLTLLAVVIYIFWPKAKPCEKLDQNISKALKDSTLTNSEFDKIVLFVQENRNSLIKCYPELENTVDLNKVLLNDIIKKHKKYFSYIKCEPDKTENTNILANLFIETSFSMVGYDNSKLYEFKETITSLLGGFDDKTIYVVNDKVYDSKINYDTLIRNNNIFSRISSIGNQKYTDFRLIFSSILDKTADDQVSILFSDLIISPNQSEKTNLGMISDSEAMIRDVFRQKSNDFSIVILKFDAKFDGKYSTYNNAQGFPYSGKRPFYATLIAKNNTMKTLLQNERFSKFSNWSNYERFRGMQFFTKINEPKIPQYYSVDVKSEKIGEYRKDNNHMKDAYIHYLSGVRTKDNVLEIPININFSDFYVPDTSLTNPKNYIIKINGKIADDFKVKEVRKIDNEPGFTHKLIIKFLNEKFNYDDGVRIDVTSNRSNSISQWVTTTNTNDDSDIKNKDFPTKTFGIQAFMDGLNEAYKSPNQALYTFSLNLKQ